jgi:hypothetical protein
MKAKPIEEKGRQQQKKARKMKAGSSKRLMILAKF